MLFQMRALFGPQHHERLVGASHVHEHLAAIGDRRRPAGLQLGRAGETRFGAAQVAAILRDHAGEKEGRSLLAAGFQRASHARPRSLELSGLVLGHRLQVPHVAAAGILREEGGIGRDRLGELPLAVAVAGDLERVDAHGPRPSIHSCSRLTRP